MKKLFLVLSALIIIIVLYSGFLFYSEINIERLNFLHRWAAKSVFDSWENYLSNISKERISIIDFETLMNQLNFYEKDFAKRVFAINPQD